MGEVTDAAGAALSTCKGELNKRQRGAIAVITTGGDWSTCERGRMHPIAEHIGVDSVNHRHGRQRCVRLKSLRYNARLEFIRVLAPTPLGRLRNLRLGLSCVHVSTQKFVDTSISLQLQEFNVSSPDAYQASLLQQTMYAGAR